MKKTEITNILSTIEKHTQRDDDGGGGGCARKGIETSM